MTLESAFNTLKSTTRGRILLHLLLWLFYYGAFYYLGSISFNGYKGRGAFLEPLRNTISSMVVYYPLVYIIWPKLIRKIYFTAVGLFLLLIILYATVDHLSERAILANCEVCLEKVKSDSHGYYQLHQRGAINVIFLQLLTLGIVYQLFVFLAFPLSVKALVEYFNQRINTLRLQRENIQLEFNFLKAQVNPHFLFNTLNNIYALILKDKKDASAETVAKLSTFMRYTLYESNSDSNNIMKEINLLQVYIELEQIRLNDTIVNFISNTDNEHHTLPPLLFMPAVENAFKFCSKNKQGDSYIFMKMDIEQSKLIFTISNTCDRTLSAAGEHGGIGLQNLEKRLAHHYPGNRSSMAISEETSVFQITIHLNLL